MLVQGLHNAHISRTWHIEALAPLGSRSRVIHWTPRKFLHHASGAAVAQVVLRKDSVQQMGAPASCRGRAGAAASSTSGRDDG